MSVTATKNLLFFVVYGASLRRYHNVLKRCGSESGYCSALKVRSNSATRAMPSSSGAGAGHA
jgi:hypothetical protein